MVKRKRKLESSLRLGRRVVGEGAGLIPGQGQGQGTDRERVNRAQKEGIGLPVDPLVDGRVTGQSLGHERDGQVNGVVLDPDPDHGRGRGSQGPAPGHHVLSSLDMRKDPSPQPLVLVEMSGRNIPRRKRRRGTRERVRRRRSPRKRKNGGNGVIQVVKREIEIRKRIEIERKRRREVGERRSVDIGRRLLPNPLRPLTPPLSNLLPSHDEDGTGTDDERSKKKS